LAVLGYCVDAFLLLRGTFGMGLGSYAGGAIHDLLGTYQWLFLGSFAIGMMAIVLGMTLRAPVAVPGPRPSPAMGA